MVKQYPYQHLELNDLIGEKWKWIPWLEGYYKISSFGRVKRESFEMIMKNGLHRVIQEKMLRSELQKFPNRYVGDQVYHLRAKIMRGGNRYEISIARVLYYCFRKKFDLNNMNLMAIALDGEGRNIRLDNIDLVNRNQRQQRIFDRKRYKKPVIYSFDEFSKGLERSANKGCRQVTQYEMNGKRIRTYLSVRAAAISLAISDSGIHAVLRERQISSGGFVWRYGAESRVDLKPLLEKRAIHRKILRGIKVSQFDAKGRRVNTYLTMTDAAKATGIKNGDISAAVSGKQKSAGGFIWRMGWSKVKIHVKEDSFGEALRAKAKWKRVRQYNTTGKYIRTFESVKAAAAKIKLSPSSISSALKSKTNLAGGYVWRL